jgi:copper chaperone CopZ
MTGAGVTKKLITVISITTLFFGLSFGNSYAETDKSPQIILRVNNLTCSDCHQAIIGGLLQLDKNILMSSDRDKRSLIITYPDTLEDKEVVRTIQKLGYKVRITTPQKQNSQVAHTQKGSRITYGYCTSTCSASSSTWKEFYRRYFANNK